jgi:hypothetical protein
MGEGPRSASGEWLLRVTYWPYRPLGRHVCCWGNAAGTAGKRTYAGLTAGFRDSGPAGQRGDEKAALGGHTMGRLISSGYLFPQRQGSNPAFLPLRHFGQRVKVCRILIKCFRTAARHSFISPWPKGPFETKRAEIGQLEQPADRRRGANAASQRPEQFSGIWETSVWGDTLPSRSPPAEVCCPA